MVEETRAAEPRPGGQPGIRFDQLRGAGVDHKALSAVVAVVIIGILAMTAVEIVGMLLPPSRAEVLLFDACGIDEHGQEGVQR
jgi:hypothetical protein